VTGSHDWMRTVLVALYDLPDQQIRTALITDSERQKLRAELNNVALADGKLGRIPEGQYGDNLLQGLLALRSRFDRATSTEKLERNLAMRTHNRRP
jgi:hypothetical protein